MGIFSRAGGISPSPTDNTTKPDESQTQGLKKAGTAAAGMVLGISSTLGALTAPSLLSTGDGPLKLSPDIGAMSLGELEKVGIRQVEISGVVGAVNQEPVKGGVMLVFEVRTEGSPYGLEVRQVLEGFNDNELYSMTRSFLEEMAGKPKQCSVKGYIVKSEFGDVPALSATQVSFGRLGDKLEGDLAPTENGWNRADFGRIIELAQETFKKGR